MAIKKYNPTSPARRNMTVSTFEEITKKSPEKSLLETKKEKPEVTIFRSVLRVTLTFVLPIHV